MIITDYIDNVARGNLRFHKEFFFELLHAEQGGELQNYLFEKARMVAQENFGTGIYIRGLIEVANTCHNNCYYCGIRRDNKDVTRYELTLDEILEACRRGYKLGFRTFVLQGGEWPSIKSLKGSSLSEADKKILTWIQAIKEEFPYCALTLSLGEKSNYTYQMFKNAGADRYLLRHETINKWHYEQLHPEEMSLAERTNCLRVLKRMNYQVGSGIMIGSPMQSDECLLDDIKFLLKLDPQMIGIGPYIPHKDTPFGHIFPAGDLNTTLNFIALCRLYFPRVLIPATTALATLDPKGRTMGILAGANVVMPNLTPIHVRNNYALYDNKANMHAEAAEGLKLLEEELHGIGYHIDYGRGDYQK